MCCLHEWNYVQPDGCAPPPFAFFNWEAPKGVLREGRVGVRVHMHKRTDSKTFARAKELHRNMTPAEVKLWARLRAHRLGGVHFRNQHAIGKYTSIRPSGTQCKHCRLLRAAPKTHYRTGWPSLRSQHVEQKEYDNDRTSFLESKGYTILRFWNNDVMRDMEGVIRAIILAMESEPYS